MICSGVDIDLLASTDKLHLLEPFPHVFARVTPENKLEIVKALQYSLLHFSLSPSY